MKKIKYIVGIFLAGIALSACQSEETTDFPDYSKNWFELQDNPSDSVDHAMYQFYQDYNIPVFANDTIGSQQRIDVFGKEYTHYEKLTLSYSMGGGLSANSSPIVTINTFATRKNIPAFLRFLRENVMPAVPKGIHIHSILLVDKMTSQAFGNDAFKGLNTLVLSNVSDLPGMDDNQKKAIRGSILRMLYSDYITNSEDYTSQLEKFYNVSRALCVEKDIYNMYTGYLRYYVTGADPSNWGHPTVQEVGFLNTDPTNSYYTPSSPFMDVMMYCEAILTYSENEFKEQYGQYPYIMEKYNILKEILNTIR
jgi:hypothetical protein